MSLPNFTFSFYKANAERRLTHAAEWPASYQGLCAWVELDPNPKPEPTQAQLDAPHGAADLWGEPQLRDFARHDLEHFRDRWLLYWNWTPEKEDAPIDPDCAAESLSPFRGNGTRAFLLDLLQYPRVLMPDGFVQIGGAQYVGIPEPTPGVNYIKTTVPCEKGFRGAFDDATARYSDYVKWLGRRCNCSGAAAKALDRFELVLGWLRHMSSISPSAFDDLEERYTQLETALEDLSIRVADFRPDNTSNTHVVSETDCRISNLEKKVETLELNGGRHFSREQQRKLGGHLLTKKIVVQDCIHRLWLDFCNGNVEDVKNLFGDKLKRREKTKRTYAQCLKLWAEHIVYRSDTSGQVYVLRELVYTEKRFEQIIHSCKQRIIKAETAARRERFAQRHPSTKSSLPKKKKST